MLRYRIALLLALLSAPVESALACSCGVSTMDVIYDAAPIVFTATVLSIERGDADYLPAAIAITEVFKGEPQFDSLRIDNRYPHCRARLRTNIEYLFFLGEDNSIGHCSRFIPVHTRARSIDWLLQMFRDYEAGLLSDLGGIWRYSDQNGLCSLGTSFSLVVVASRTSSLQIQHRHSRNLAATNPDDPRQQPWFNVVRLSYHQGIGRIADETEARLTVDGRVYLLEHTPAETADTVYELRGEQGVELAQVLKADSIVSVRFSWLRNGVSSSQEGQIAVSNGGEAFNQFRACLYRSAITN